MKALYFFATALLAAAVVDAQPPNAPAPVAASPANTEPRLAVSAAEIAARIAQATAAAQAHAPFNGEPLLQSGPFRAGLEYHDAPATSFAVHERDAELFVVLEGSGTLSVGGALVDPQRRGSNLVSARVTGAVPHKVEKGDMVLVPENTPHAVTGVNGRLVLMSMHLPRPAAQ